MRQTNLFTKTRKEAPSDEVSKNAELLIRAGFIRKDMSGVYSYLPLGLRVMDKIINVIREEMNALGAQEVLLSSLQEKETWLPTNQWSDEEVDVWFKTKLKNETELGLAFTHEAAMTKMAKDQINSYKDLPLLVYHFQTKFRNETRAKSGIMRCREFLMKDLYSFSRNEEDHQKIYDKIKEAYQKIFKRIGIGHKTFFTFASGGVFAKFSHEFQTVTSAGEDKIFIDQDKGLAVNQEVMNDEVLTSLSLSKDNMIEETSAEVGNIFTLGTRFSKALDLEVLDEEGNRINPVMGSYGIGPGRVMGTVVEVLSDDKGIIWPEAIAPFKVHLLMLGNKDAVKEEAEALYKSLVDAGVEVLYDDREGSAGEKFADSDLIGIPYRVVVSERSLADGGYEVKKRTEEKGEIVKKDNLVAMFV